MTIIIVSIPRLGGVDRKTILAGLVVALESKEFPSPDSGELIERNPKEG